MRELEAEAHERPDHHAVGGAIVRHLAQGLLAEAGQHGLQTFSIGFESVGDVAGDEFVYSDIVAKHFGTDHHQIRIDTARMLPALDGAIGAMSEPMVSHDCVAFYLLSQEVSKHVKVVQSGQGADEVFAGYHWYPPLAEPGAASTSRPSRDVSNRAPSASSPQQLPYEIPIVPLSAPYGLQLVTRFAVLPLPLDSRTPCRSTPYAPLLSKKERSSDEPA